MREAEGLTIGSVRGHAVAHVKVDASGGLFLNGRRAGLEELREECARLSRLDGAVLYFREKPWEEAPRAAVDVCNAIADARLPVSFAGRDYDPAVKVEEYFAEGW